MTRINFLCALLAMSMISAVLAAPYAPIGDKIDARDSGNPNESSSSAHPGGDCTFNNAFSPPIPNGQVGCCERTPLVHTREVCSCKDGVVKTEKKCSSYVIVNSHCDNAKGKQPGVNPCTKLHVF